MIITCKKQIPMSWVTMATLPWAAEQFKSHVMGVCLLFSLKKFIENPAGITFILTLPGWISIFLAPASSYLSDCVWTRFGRRKPFIVPPWFGMATAMILMPLAPNMWSVSYTHLTLPTSD